MPSHCHYMGSPEGCVDVSSDWPFIDTYSPYGRSPRISMRSFGPSTSFFKSASAISLSFSRFSFSRSLARSRTFVYNCFNLLVNKVGGFVRIRLVKNGTPFVPSRHIETNMSYLFTHPIIYDHGIGHLRDPFRSFCAPVVIRPNTISSATRPPMAMVIRSISASLVYK